MGRKIKIKGLHQERIRVLEKKAITRVVNTLPLIQNAYPPEIAS
jgi:hypothetical protein